MTKRTRLLLAAAAAFACLSGATLLATDAGTPLQQPPTTEELTSRISACTTPGTPPGTAQACLTPWWLYALENNQVATLDTSVYGELNTNHILALNCHDAGHFAGQEAVRNGGNAATLLSTALQAQTCEGGLMHGVLDAVSDTTPSPDTISELTNICLTATLTQNRSLCADGVGHAAWHTTSDVNDAITWCATINTYAERFSCVGGIVMQATRTYRDGRPPAIDVAQNPEKLAELCLELATSPATREDLDACYLHAAKLLPSPASEPTIAWATSVQEGNEDARAWKDTATAWAAARAGCATFPPERQTACTNEVTKAPRDVVPQAFTASEHICRVWPTPQDQNTCRSTFR